MKLPSLLNSFVSHGISLLSPPACPVCRAATGKHALSILCPQCRPAVKPRPVCQRCGHGLPDLRIWQLHPSAHCRACRMSAVYFDRARSVGFYQGTWKKAVLLYKTSPSYELTLQFASLCRKIICAGQLSGKWQGVIPVPKRKPAIHAAEQLAGQLAKRIQCPYVQALKFRKKTLPQHTLSRKQRLLNMRDSLAVKKGLRLSGTWLLVDDIHTTGATLNECARVLKKAGAEQVEAITLARGLDYRVGVE